MATYDELIQAAKRADKAGAKEDARRLADLAVAQRDAERGAPEIAGAVEVAPPSAVSAELLEARAQEAIDARIQQLVEERDVALRGLTAAQREAVVAPLRREAEREVQRPRERVVQPGVAEPVQLPSDGVFRPTRIVETAEGRFYRDPETGELREPTALEEVRESFALQTVLGEEAAREAARRGETPLGVLGEEVAGAGVVETELGAALRSALGYGSALAGELYFRGLGYEVDEEGQPVDPDDFGLQIAKAREALGLPAVIRAPGEAGALYGIPLPGVATRSTSRPAYELDPDGRRRASSVEVPGLLEDPAGFLEAETKRLAQNVASGRSIADEFRDAPEVAAYYAEVWGDPDAAYYAGIVPELFIPGGPGVTAQGAKKLGEVATKNATRAALGAVEAAEKALESTVGVGTVDEVARGLEALQRAALEYAVEARRPIESAYALVNPGAKSDEIVARRVAERSVAATLGADVAEEVIRRAPLRGAASAEDVVAGLRPVLEELDVDPGPVERLVRLNMPGDFVAIGEDLAVPRALANDLELGARDFVRGRVAGDPSTADVVRGLDATLTEGVDLARPFKAQPPPIKRRLVEGLRQDFVERAAPGVAKRSADLGLAQIYFERGAEQIGGVLGSRLLRSPNFARAAALVPGLGRLSDVSKLGGEVAARIERQGRRAPAVVERLVAREVSRISDELARAGRAGLDDLAEETRRQGGVVAKAVDALLEQTPPEEAWTRLLGMLYGERAVEAGLEPLQALAPALGIGERAPTISALYALDRVASTSGAPWARFGRKLNRPQFLRAALSYLTQDKVAPALARATAADELLVRGAPLAEVAYLLDDPLLATRPDAFLLDPDLVELVGRYKDGRTTLSAPDATYFRELGLDQSFADALASSGAGLVDLVDFAPPAARGNLLQWAREWAEWVAAEGRLGITQGLKYGYVLPNLPLFVYRGIESPFIAFANLGSQIGLAEAAETVALAARSALAGRRRTGGGLTTPEGLYYSGDELITLGEELGLGVTRATAERVGRVAQDLVDDVYRLIPRAKGLEDRADDIPPTERWRFDPVAKNFWTRTAEAVDRSWRQGLFEARLLAGDDPATAARRAREAALDFDQVPGPVRERIASVVQGASTAWQTMTELAILGAKSPRALNGYLKALEEQKKVQDPYNVEGDLSLLNLDLGDVPGVGELRVPGPGSQFLVAMISAARAADVVGANLLRSATSGAEGVAEVIAKDDELLSYRTGDALVEGALRALEAREEGVSPLRPLLEGVKRLEPFSDERAFWTAALAAHDADPGHDNGAWSMFVRVFDPVVVPPPADRAHPRISDGWISVPPGTPHVVLRDLEGRPYYQVLEMGPRGELNVAALRAATPAELERALPIAAAELVPGIASGAPPAPARILTVYAPEVLEDSALREYLQSVINPYRLGREPLAERERQAAEALRVREDITAP
jgi:hypothetical protein